MNKARYLRNSISYLKRITGKDFMDLDYRVEHSIDRKNNDDMDKFLNEILKLIIGGKYVRKIKKDLPKN